MSAPKRFRSPSVILILIVLLGLGLRLIQLDFQPLWWDEGYSVWFAAHSLAEMTRLTAADIHPPLYYALLHGWTQLLGMQPVSLRLFSVLVSLPAIPLAYALGRDMRDRATGLIAALLVAVNPFAIFYAQEIRMYGLAATLSLAALWTGWRWAEVSRKDARAQREKEVKSVERGKGGKDRFSQIKKMENRASRKEARAQGENGKNLSSLGGLAPLREAGSGWMWGVAYGLSVLAGLYTLYLFALLPLAQFLWILIARRPRLKAWFITLTAVALLYLPWALYAGPKLLHYVAYKVVMDNDQPLGLIAYLGQHLSAFLVGHLEGPLAQWWPWTLLLLLPLVVFSVQSSVFSKQSSVFSASSFLGGLAPLREAYLLSVLVVALAVGFIQQMRAPFIPEHFQRVLLFAAPALWLLLALGLRALGQARPRAAWGFAALFLLAQAASLTAFYTTPRYVERDYRPLVEAMRQELRPSDSIFVIYPWQAGYFLAYLPESFSPELVSEARPPWNEQQEPITPILLNPEPDWTPALQQNLETLLQYGGVWFPEHLSLGGILEGEVEAYLQRRTFSVTNRWYGAETRLTAWDEPRGAGHQTELPPVQWKNGVALQSGWFVEMPYRLFVHLAWQGGPVQDGAEGAYALWLRGPDGQRWARRDVVKPWQAQDDVALTLPAGLPPGRYELLITLLDADLRPIATTKDEETPLATLELAAPPHVLPQPRHPQVVAGDGLDFLGHDGGDTPVLPGDDLQVTLFWRAHGPVTPQQTLFLQLLDAKKGLVAGMEAPPLAWLPTPSWPDAPLRTQHRLRIPADLAPGDYELIAGLFDAGSRQRWQWAGKDALHLGDVQVQARTHTFTPPQPAQRLDARWQGGHKLVGFSLDVGQQPDAAFQLTLFWQPAGPTEARYSVFVHVVDAQGELLAQDDAEPAAGAHPTSSWLADEFITDVHTLPLPDVPGPLTLQVGLYDPATGHRLALIDDQGQIIGDFLSIPLHND